jgi:hypothetical protein
MKKGFNCKRQTIQLKNLFCQKEFTQKKYDFTPHNHAKYQISIVFE